jgi:hypothetical protein
MVPEHRSNRGVRRLLSIDNLPADTRFWAAINDQPADAWN